MAAAAVQFESHYNSTRRLQGFGVPYPLSTISLGATSVKVLFLFPTDMDDEQRAVAAGESPSERLYGAVELTSAGMDAHISNRRFGGRSGGWVRALRRRGINAIDPTTMEEFRTHDVVLFKDSFSLMAVFVARILGTRFYFYDSMFELPRSRLRRLTYRWCIAAAAGTIAFSSRQVTHWRDALGVPAGDITAIPYAIDVEVYRRGCLPRLPGRDARPFVLAIGRDRRRDFGTLMHAMQGLEIDLCLVTLPYLLEGTNWRQSWISVLEWISYARLFELYCDAFAVVVPLEETYTYPFGGARDARRHGARRHGARMPGHRHANAGARRVCNGGRSPVCGARKCRTASDHDHFDGCRRVAGIDCTGAAEGRARLRDGCALSGTPAGDRRAKHVRDGTWM